MYCFFRNNALRHLFFLIKVSQVNNVSRLQHFAHATTLNKVQNIVKAKIR